MDPLAPPAPELAQTQTQGSARGAAGPAGAQARWRLELERAQLKLRPDARPAPPAPAKSAAPGDPLREPAPAGRQAAPEPGARRTQQESAVSASKESFFKGTQQAGAAGQPPTAGMPAERPAFAGAPAQPREIPSPPAAPQPVPGGRAPQRTVWPNTNAFALVSDGEVKAWLRDASLGEAERKRLLRELRVRLRAAGLQLDTLTVNGREEST